MIIFEDVIIASILATPTLGLLAYFLGGDEWGPEGRTRRLFSRKGRRAIRQARSDKVLNELRERQRAYRRDDRLRWMNEYRALEASTKHLLPIEAKKSKGGAIIGPERMSSTAVAMLGLTPKELKKMYGWDGKHHATCPYECDCPSWARLRNNG